MSEVPLYLVCGVLVRPTSRLSITISLSLGQVVLNDSLDSPEYMNEQVHARPFVGVFKSQSPNIFQETGAPLGQRLTKAHQWLQERTWDTPTKGLLWT